MLRHCNDQLARVRRGINLRNTTIVLRSSYVTMAYLTGHYAMEKMIYGKNEVNNRDIEDFRHYFAYAFYFSICIASGTLNAYSSHLFSKNMLRSIEKLSEFRRTNSALFYTFLSLATLTAVTPSATILNGGTLIPDTNEAGKLVNSFLESAAIRWGLSSLSFATILPIFAEDFIESRQIPETILLKFLEKLREIPGILSNLDRHTVPNEFRRIWHHTNFKNLGLMLGNMAIWSLPFLGVAQSIGYAGVPVRCLQQREIIGKDRAASEILTYTTLVAARVPFIATTTCKSYEAWELYKTNNQNNLLSKHWKSLIMAFLNSLVLSIIFCKNSSALDNMRWDVTIVFATLLFGTLARIKNLDFTEGQPDIPVSSANYQQFDIELSPYTRQRQATTNQDKEDVPRNYNTTGQNILLGARIIESPTSPPNPLPLNTPSPIPFIASSVPSQSSIISDSGPNTHK
jgi:hypothetical protein